MKAKYTEENLLRYGCYLIVVRSLPLPTLHFLDEAHFDHRDFARSRVCGPRNSSRRVVITEYPLGERYSSTVLLSPGAVRPLRFGIRTETNSQWDFLHFLLEAAATGAFQPGDFLILDNARIHFAAESQDLLIRFLDFFRIRLLFLPTYSPELNPCELVWASVKRFLRDNDFPGVPPTQSIFMKLALMPREDIINYCLHCIYKPSLLM